MKNTCTIYLAFVVVAVGCSSTSSLVRTKKLSELSNFPRSNHTDRILFNPWEYLGTYRNHHYFDYTYYTAPNRVPRVLQFRIRRKQLSLEFERPASVRIPVRPEYNGEQVVGFKKVPSVFDAYYDRKFDRKLEARTDN